MERIKQVILIRKDLKMRRGKEIAQGSHASMQFMVEPIVEQINRHSKENADSGNLSATLSLSQIEKTWLTMGMAKVCLRVDSEEQLFSLHKKASDAGLKSYLITDSGRTEFKGKPTPTACAIGPDLVSAIDTITGDLTPY